MHHDEAPAVRYNSTTAGELYTVGALPQGLHDDESGCESLLQYRVVLLGIATTISQPSQSLARKKRQASSTWMSQLFVKLSVL